jgi:hypothetical protein
MRRLTIALALLPLTAVAAPVQAQTMTTVTPDQIGQIFCISRTGNDDGILDGLLTPELRTLIAYSEARNDTIAVAHPDEKPPLGDGIPFASFPDYASRCDIESIAIDGSTARVAIGYGFPDAPTADYTDTLDLRLVPHPYNPDIGIWRIDDIRYTTSGTLRETLNTAFAAE